MATATSGKFKVGDRIRWLGKFNATMFTPGTVYEVVGAEGNRYRVTDNDDATKESQHSWDGEGIAEHFALLIPAAPSAIRTVTRREIVPGSYGAANVTAANAASVYIDLGADNAANELREAAHLLNQIAEVLEENAALEMKEAA